MDTLGPVFLRFAFRGWRAECLPLSPTDKDPPLSVTLAGGILDHPFLDSGRGQGMMCLPDSVSPSGPCHSGPEPQGPYIKASGGAGRSPRRRRLASA